MLIPNMAPGMVAMQFGAMGPNTSTVTACASGGSVAVAPVSAQTVEVICQSVG